jgi:hypothetical protein
MNEGLQVCNYRHSVIIPHKDLFRFVIVLSFFVVGITYRVTVTTKRLLLNIDKINDGFYNDYATNKSYSVFPPFFLFFSIFHVLLIFTSHSPQFPSFNSRFLLHSIFVLQFSPNISHCYLWARLHTSI